MLRNFGIRNEIANANTVLHLRGLIPAGIVLENCDFRNDNSSLINEIPEEEGQSSIIPMNFTGDDDVDASNGTLFVFKFFWRFFRGRKTIICQRGGCRKYDSFADSMIRYKDGADESFFDFSWRNMHGKPLKVIVNTYSDEIKVARSFESAFWFQIMYMFLEHFERSFNCTVNPNRNFQLTEPFIFGRRHDSDKNLGLKYAADLEVFSFGVTVEDTDFSIFDFSIGFETNALCIAAPHSEFMSQGLVIFKSCKLSVWVAILLTVVLFVFMQAIFQRSQCRLFRRLYSEAELLHYESAPSLLIVYSYFILGSPPSLHLGRLRTGRILFVLFSFSALLISTIFLSGMTTLLSNRVSYPEIDTLEALEESEHFIQVFDVDDTTAFLNRFNLSQKLISKLTGTLEFFSTSIFYFLKENETLVSLLSNGTVDQTDENDIFHRIEKNGRSIAMSDAFLTAIPHSHVRKKDAFIQHILLPNRSEYHLIDECLVTYPYLSPFLKNSFYSDKLNGVMTRCLETGHVGKFLTSTTEDELTSHIITAPPPPANTEPRAYTLNDLQTGFTGLFLGLFLSFLAFVAELSVDYFKIPVSRKVLSHIFLRSVLESPNELLQEALELLYPEAFY
ncbi:unnamed protein product [Bemisia tabaci]|uniref:Ionotropic receptor n=1 Tax=Bemisia tabaci TaxID=7038 RepID=A0A9P0A4F6_BEMTA|nr:unnamed protein product [Bemisia tabaci]